MIEGPAGKREGAEQTWQDNGDGDGDEKIRRGGVMPRPDSKPHAGARNIESSFPKRTDEVPTSPRSQTATKVPAAIMTSPTMKSASQR
jgi:hypothetical protein